MRDDLKDRCGIVTGAASGIGRAGAIHLAGRGARVALIDINGEGLAETEATIKEAGYPEPLAIVADAAVEDQVNKFVADSLAEFGKIDFLVNSAGILMRTGFEKIESAEWDEMIGVNLRGPFLCCKAVIGPMLEQGSGVIVNIASLAGRTCSILGGAHYTTVKHGLVGFSRHLAREFGPRGIRINAFCPGGTLTPMVTDQTDQEEIDRVAAALPRRQWGAAEEQARVIGFMVSDDSINIMGACLDSNGGGVML